MLPIKQLLDKIRWDKRENPDSYTLYYYDRIKDNLVELRYKDIADIKDGFIIINKKHIPLHRIKQVKKDGKVIWSRI